MARSVAFERHRRPYSKLQGAIERLRLPGVRIGYRIVLPGDEYALLPEENCATLSLKSHRARGAARIIARKLLSSSGCALKKWPTGAPVWPSGIVGSLAHVADVAVAAVASRQDFVTVGIDIEPAAALSPDILETIATPLERLSLKAYAYGGRLLFAAKEAVFKAVSDLDHIFLDHKDVEVDFSKQEAIARNGRRVQLRFSLSTHLLALAFVRHTGSTE